MIGFSKGGIVFHEALAIAFIVMKLCRFIDWSWVWVLAPIWIVFGVEVAKEIAREVRRK